MGINGFIDEIKKFLSPEQIVQDDEGRSHYCYDATELKYMPDIVLLPSNTEEVSKIMKLAYEHDIPVTPQGGRTGLSGGALPIKGGIVLSLLKMKKIIEIDEKNMQVVVEPGVISSDLQKELKKYNLFFPPDPSSTIESTIGGNVAENAGYTRAVKYGVTRDYVLGIEAVLPNGDIIKVGGRTLKNVAGYDLTSLLVGSEGTLAIVTKIIFKLLPMPKYRKTLIFYLDNLEEAAEFIVNVFKNGIIPCAIELMDNTTINTVADYLTTNLRREAAALVLIEVDGSYENTVLAEAESILKLSENLKGVIESRLASDDKEAEKLWIIRRESLPSLKALGKDHLEADVAVPRYKLPFLVKAIKEIGEGKKIKIATYGHAGDGNLHVTILYRKTNFTEINQAHEALEEIYKRVIDMDGTLTGEHGIGLTAKEYLTMQMSKSEISLMKRIKQAFDHKGLLNPGKIFPEE